MEGSSTKGVLNHLDLLKVQARSRRCQPQQQSRVKELKAKVESLRLQREQLKAEIRTHKELRSSLDKRQEDEGEEEMDQDSEDSQLLRLMARHTQLKDLLNAHRLIGGYDIVKTREGKGVCVSLAAAYEGVYLETYNLQINLKPTARIVRHNIPPIIPLDSIAEQTDMNKDLKTFLDVLHQHLNGFAGRKQQLKLVKEQHKSVEVMESNVLCSILVLMLTVPKKRAAVLCTLDYADRTTCLPTRVQFECEDKLLTDSPQWKNDGNLLMETPLHKALSTMKKMGNII